MDRRVLELEEAEQNRLLGDAGIGRQVFMFYVSAKITVFYQLPLAVLGIGCFDWGLARQITSRVLTMFSNMLPGWDHPRVADLCVDLHDDVRSFIDGGGK